ncbi:NB-ARC domain-containing protein [Oxynema sp. CENA135]|uniref:NB-ARC domain-containing protein n=1 Tax=Oxynema sp. CENA135 TaxID=984206 RepID=UPI00190E121F|nr:NB-ARC domain-containing protein [Oxynema sp. CENA135]
MMSLDSKFQEFLDAQAKHHALSRAEWEALSLAVTGHEISAIAEQLHVRPEAIRQRLSQVYQKFNIQGRGPVKLAKLQKLLQQRYQEYCIAREAELGSCCCDRLGSSIPQDWGNAPDLSSFYGREAELATLEHWIVGDRCRSISILGLGGIGKTSLAIAAVKEVLEAGNFDRLIWRSLSHAPTPETLLDDLLLRFYPETLDPPAAIATKMTLVIEGLRSRRCLIVLDDVETILRPGDRLGRYQSGYEVYGQLFQRVGESPHQSTFLILSQEKLREISLLAGSNQPVRLLKLDGLKLQDARQLLQEKHLTGQPEHWQELIDNYRGNPLALKIVATTIQEVFGCSVDRFIKYKTLVIKDLFLEVLERQFERLSPLEQKIVFYLAQNQYPHSLEQIHLQMKTTNLSHSDLIEPLESLSGRSLIEKTKNHETHEPLFTLQPVIRKYAIKYHLAEMEVSESEGAAIEPTPL